uniref:C2H2-type domain-containing protein n=1 Tax=Dendroctonus ponderosae TaxID=77166 RepID=A0AAR5PBD6_DENPD
MEAINNCSLQVRAKPDCSTIGLKFDVGATTFQLWCTLKHSFACHSNEGFLAKLLEIAQEYLVSEQGQSDGDSGNSSSSAPLEPEDAPKLPRSRKKGPKGGEAQEPCRYCDASHCDSDCPVHKPAELVADAPALWDGFCKSPELARSSLPSCLAFGARDTGVVAKRGLAAHTQFGPLIGAKRTAGRNLTVLIKDSGLYLVSIRALLAGEELLYWQDTFEAGGRKKPDKTACGGCNMAFEHPLHYKVHCSLFHDTRFSLTIRKYHCKVCGAAVLGKDNIRKHAAEQHNGKGAYQCQFCSKFFLRLNYLEMHRTYGCSANPQRSKSLCDFCGRNFCQPQKLKIHIKRMHSDLADALKDFQCSKCLKLLGSRAALQRHIKEVHDKQGDASYPCTVCTKHFQNKSNLKIHMLTHSGIKPFKCTVADCGAAFTTKQCLQLHYRKVHSFDENSMPKIERAVSYTLQAYSGDQKAQPEPPAAFEEAPLGLHTVEQMIKEPAAKGEKKWESLRAASFEGAQPKYSIADTSNASLLVEAALDSVCNDASLDIDVEVSHTVPDCPDLYALQDDYQSQDINLISPSVDHVSVTDELEGDSKGPGLQYGLAEDQFRPKGAESAPERAAFAPGGWPGDSPRRYEPAHPDLLEDAVEGKGPLGLRVKPSIRMHDYFRRSSHAERVNPFEEYSHDP